VAGALSDREIGVLLPCTGSVGAVAVTSRIQARLESGDGDGRLRPTAIGLVSRAPGGEQPAPIVQSARDDAARRRLKSPASRQGSATFDPGRSQKS